jgi:intracellular sulfur oxidation DsrE/DsrF family protein
MTVANSFSKALFIRNLVIFIIFFLNQPDIASAGTTQEKVNNIVNDKQTPFGVVFEIVESDSKALQWAIPAINHYVQQLRQRFPDLGIAVVSHGREEFGLMKTRQKQLPEVHSAVQSLVASDVTVQVCGTHASWRGKTAEDFPDYVSVVPAGPTEIRNYEDMGYIRIVVRKSS